jgi:hypothetical protein
VWLQLKEQWLLLDQWMVKPARVHPRTISLFASELYEIHPSSFAFALASCQARAKKWASWIEARLWSYNVGAARRSPPR